MLGFLDERVPFRAIWTLADPSWRHISTRLAHVFCQNLCQKRSRRLKWNGSCLKMEYLLQYSIVGCGIQGRHLSVAHGSRGPQRTKNSKPRRDYRRGLQTSWPLSLLLTASPNAPLPVSRGDSSGSLSLLSRTPLLPSLDYPYVRSTDQS